MGFAGPKYLASITPSRFMHSFEAALPDKMLGSEFMQRYGDHGDPVTQVYNLMLCGMDACCHRVLIHDPDMMCPLLSIRSPLPHSIKVF